jgi:methyl-accepting chemotaxis protein
VKAPARKLQAYSNRMPLLLIFLTLPWLWAALIVPWWVSVIGLIILPAAAAMIVVAVFPSPPASRRVGDDTQLSDGQIEKMRDASSGLHNLLERWSTVSRNTGTSLESARQQVDDVILHSEAAVLEITKGFLEVTRKTRTQMEYALSLLQQAKSPDGDTAQKDRDLSLPEYIRASEAMLRSLTSRLLHFSETSLGLVQRQEKVREQTRRIDDLLDQMTSLAGQVGRFALSTSTMAQGSRQHDFTQMADKVRGLSQAANDLSRDVRQSLEGIKAEMSEAHTALNNMAREARTTAQQALDEVEPLGKAMLDKNRQVENILDRINIAGHDIQQDINQIIIAMQFQDIIQQKLERIKTPVFTQLLDALRSLSEETRFLNQRINPKLVDVSVATSTGRFRVVRNGEVTTVTAPEEKPTAPEEKRSGDASGKIELF